MQSSHHQQQQQQFQDPNLFMYTPSMEPLFQVDQSMPLDNGQLLMLPVDQSLSVEINPCISITEPTPVYAYPLTDSPPYVDNLWATYLSTQTGSTDWLSWTPMNGNSPASVTSNHFDERQSQHCISPEPIYFPVVLPEENYNARPFSIGYPSPTSSVHSDTVKSRPRRISEPPMPFQDQFQLEFYPPPPKGSQTTNKRRKRSNSTHHHTCPHPGCGKHFTRPYNLTSHMRTHTADRPFACSQCGRRFARQHDRNRHEKLHWGIKPYACMHCKKPFARMDALNRHLRVDNGCQQQIQNEIQKQLDQQQKST